MASGDPTGADLVSGTTNGNTLATYGNWTEREITFDTASSLQFLYVSSDTTKQGAQSTTRSWYQSFIPTTTVTLTGLEINIDSVVSGTARATIYFYNADVDGKPTGAPLGGGSLGSLSTESTGWQGDVTLSGSVTLTIGNRYCFRLQGLISAGEYHFDFDSTDGYGSGTCWYWNGSDYVAQNGDIDFKIYGTGSGVELTNGTTYAIVVKAPDTVGSGELNWSARTDNPYANGILYRSNNSGSSWATITANADVWFKTKAGGVEKEDGSFAEDVGNTSYSAYGATWLAQTFIASSTYTISSVVLKLAQYLDFGGSIETVTVSIKATEAALPGIPTAPSPGHTDTEVDFSDLTLSWDSGGDTDTYDVWVGDSVDLYLVSEGQVGTSYVTNLDEVFSAYDDKVYWAIDAINDEGTTEGDTWNFDARPGQVSTFTPLNEATGLTLSAVGSTWDSPSDNTDSYDVYFGTESGSWVYVGNTVDLLLDLVGVFPIYNHTYYWVIDAVNDFGITLGNEVSFTTISFYPPLPTGVTLDGDGNPTGTPLGLNFMTAIRKLVVAANSKIWYEDL